MVFEWYSQCEYVSLADAAGACSCWARWCRSLYQANLLDERFMWFPPPTEPHRAFHASALQPIFFAITGAASCAIS
jgi:hypothetical protein